MSRAAGDGGVPPLFAWIGAGTALAMAVVSAATIVWSIELAGTAPWFFSRRTAGQGGSALAPDWSWQRW